MQKTMLIGASGSGKASLIRALGAAEVCGRSQAVEYCGPFIIAPGEYIERHYYTSLITTAADCAVLLILHDATQNSSFFPPQFAAMFNRQVVGVATKIDAPTARPELAERFLHSAGARHFVRTSAKTGQGLAELHTILE